MLLRTHVYIINGEKAMNLKDRKERYMRGGWREEREGENDELYYNFNNKRHN